MMTRVGSDEDKLFKLLSWAQVVIADKQVRELVDRGMLPTSVHDIIYVSTEGSMTARRIRALAARNFARLKRDYPEEYEKLVSENQDTGE